MENGSGGVAGPGSQLRDTEFNDTDHVIFNNLMSLKLILLFIFQFNKIVFKVIVFDYLINFIINIKYNC